MDAFYKLNTEYNGKENLRIALHTIIILIIERLPYASYSHNIAVSLIHDGKSMC